MRYALALGKVRTNGMANASGGHGLPNCDRVAQGTARDTYLVRL